jgi:hypothetical protein
MGKERMDIRRLVILQLAGFLPRGTLGHGCSLVTMRHDDEGVGGGVKKAEGFWPLLL